MVSNRAMLLPQALWRYLQQPVYRDVVYQALMFHVTSLRPAYDKRSVLAHVLFILKMNLPNCVPSEAALAQLDAFLTAQEDTVAAAPGDTNLAALHHYVRSLVRHFLRARAAEKPLRRSHRTPAAAATADLLAPAPSATQNATAAGSSAAGGASSSAASSSAAASVSAGSAAAASAAASAAVSAAAAAAAAAAASSRVLPRRRRPKMGKRNAWLTMMHWPLIGGLHARFGRGGEAAPAGAADADVLLWAEHEGVAAGQLPTIVRAKKAAEARFRKSQVSATPLRHELVQYKCYREQQPLKMSEEQMDQVVGAAVSPADGDSERKLMASRILVKVVIDLYLSDDGVATNTLMALLLEMLEHRNVSVKVDAFNLLFNLAVHVNLLEGADPGHPAAPPAPPPPEALDCLFDVLRAMLLWLVHSDTTDATVWRTAFAALAFFVARGGGADRARLRLLDPRILPEILMHTELVFDAEAHALLLRLLFLQLYRPDGGGLDAPLLDAIGVDFVAQRYCRAAARESRELLFAVLFDWCVAQLAAAGAPPDPDHVQYVLELMVWLGWPAHLPDLLTHRPERGLSARLLPFFAQFKKADRRLVAAMLGEWDRLAKRLAALEPEFAARLREMLATGVPADHFDVLNCLLHSDVPSHRRNGELWLLALLRARLLSEMQQQQQEQQQQQQQQQQNEGAEGAAAAAAATTTAATTTAATTTTATAAAATAAPPAAFPLALSAPLDSSFEGLVASGKTHVRRVYLAVVEKLLLELRYQCQGFGNEVALAAFFSRMNQMLLLVVKFQETNAAILLEMFNIVFRCISVSKDALGLTPPAEDAALRFGGSPAQRFRQRLEAVSRPLLHRVDARLLSYLLLRLPDAFDAAAKVAVLALVIEKCRTEPPVLETIGGMPVFQRLLDCTIPAVAYLAGRFIIDYLIERNPEQYRAILEKVLIRAQEEDENIVSNPYLLSQAIIDLYESAQK